MLRHRLYFQQMNYHLGSHLLRLFQQLHLLQQNQDVHQAILRQKQRLTLLLCLRLLPTQL